MTRTRLTATADTVRAGVLAAFESELGDAVVGVHLASATICGFASSASRGSTRSRTSATSTAAAGSTSCRPSTGCRRRSVATKDSEVDTIVHGEPKSQPWNLEPGVAGGDTRFQMLARVVDVRTRHVGVLLKSDVPDDTMTMPTWTKVFPGADWHERETWEMYGINFDGHPNRGTSTCRPTSKATRCARTSRCWRAW